jgi:hypothetical protein
MFVTGSIINPRIFISTSMSLCSKPLTAHVHAISIYAPESIGSACTGLADYASDKMSFCSKLPLVDARLLPNYAPKSVGSARGRPVRTELSQ